MNVTCRIRKQNDQSLPTARSFSAVAGEAPADRPVDLFRVRGLSDPTEFELLVDFRSHPYADARGPARHGHRAGNALNPPCRSRLQVDRKHHARRQLWLAIYYFAFF